MEMALSRKPGIVCMTGEGVTLWTWKWFGFFKYLNYMYDTGERNEPEKIIKIRKKKQPLDPLSYPSNLHTRPHLWQISGGGGSGPPVPPPLDPRMPLCEFRI